LIPEPRRTARAGSPNLTPQLHAALVAQVERIRGLEKKLGRIVPLLFPHLEGPHVGTSILDPRKAWRQACKQAGLPGVLIHDLRRSAVRNMEKANVPRSVAMKISGHKTENVYRRYAIVSDADLKAAAARVAEVNGNTVNGSEQVRFGVRS